MSKINTVFLTKVSDGVSLHMNSYPDRFGQSLKWWLFRFSTDSHKIIPAYNVGEITGIQTIKLSRYTKFIGDK